MGQIRANSRVSLERKVTDGIKTDQEWRPRHCLPDTDPNRHLLYTFVYTGSYLGTERASSSSAFILTVRWVLSHNEHALEEYNSVNMGGLRAAQGSVIASNFPIQNNIFMHFGRAPPALLQPVRQRVSQRESKNLEFLVFATTIRIEFDYVV